MIQRFPARLLDRRLLGDVRKRCGVRNFVVSLQLVVLALAGGLLGCSGDDERPPLGGFGGQGNGVATGPCDQDEQRECGITLDQGDGLVTCYRGVQFCQDGMWSSCIDGEVTTEADPTSPEFQGFFRKFDIEALSTAPTTTCSPVDACDPYCYEVAENAATASFTPGGFITQNELCATGDPTPTTECSSTTVTTNKCVHDICTTGAALTSGCDACVTKVCAVKPACCSTSWDSTCVSEAYAQCLNSPPPMGLCDFGVYSKTTIVTANGPNFGSSSKIGGLGNLIIDTDGASGFPSSVVTPCNLWVKNTNSAGPIPVANGIWVGGSGVWDAGSGTSWTADMHFGRGVYFYGQNSVTGKVYASGNYSLASGTPTGCTGPTGWPPSITSTSNNIEGQANTNVINGSAYAAGTMGTYPTVNPAANKFVSQGTTVVPA